MFTDNAVAGKPAAEATRLPASLTPVLVERLARRVTAGPAERVTACAPYSGAPIAKLPASAPEDVIAAFLAARRAQRAWQAMPIGQRKRIMLRFHDLVLARQDEILDLIQAENGKSRRDAFLEVADIALTARYYARSAGAQLRPRRRRGAFPVLTRTTELRHPKGVVGIVSPRNYPFSLAVGDTIPALLAGNAVVQKPDIQTALCALWRPSCCMRPAFPRGCGRSCWAPGVRSGRR